VNVQIGGSKPASDAATVEGSVQVNERMRLMNGATERSVAEENDECVWADGSDAVDGSEEEWVVLFCGETARMDDDGGVG